MKPTGRRTEPRRHQSESRSRWRPRWFIAGPLVVLVVGVFLVALAETASSTTLTFSIGRGLATVHWKPVEENPNDFEQPPQPFRGAVGGISVSGVATMPLTTFNPPPSNPTAPLLLEIANWEGTLGREPFDVAIFLQYPDQAPSDDPTSSYPAITFFGAWGNELVLGSVDAPSRAELKSGRGPLRFRGTVGDLSVVGKLTQPTGTRHEQSGTATFVVSR
jgi:hypothetical protein